MKAGTSYPVSGVVVGVVGSIGPSDAIRYTIRVNMPGGSVSQIDNVRPTVPQWLVGFDVIPFPVGWPLREASIVGKTLVWYDCEPPAFEDCEGPEPQPIREPDPLDAVALDVNGQPTGGGGGLSGGFGSGGGTVADVGIGGSTK